MMSETRLMRYFLYWSSRFCRRANIWQSSRKVRTARVVAVVRLVSSSIMGMEGALRSTPDQKELCTPYWGNNAKSNWSQKHIAKTDSIKVLPSK